MLGLFFSPACKTSIHYLHSICSLTHTTRRFRFALFENSDRSPGTKVSNTSVTPGHAKLRTSGSASARHFTGYLTRHHLIFSRGVEGRPCEAKKVREYLRSCATASIAKLREGDFGEAPHRKRKGSRNTPRGQLSF
jgi:hypothetical protein